MYLIKANQHTNKIQQKTRLLNRLMLYVPTVITLQLSISYSDISVSLSNITAARMTTLSFTLLDLDVDPIFYISIVHTASGIETIVITLCGFIV